jgi:hypothetical protein
MKKRLEDGWSPENARVLVEEIRATRVTRGPHLTADQLDAFVEETLAPELADYAVKHIAWCEECAIEVIARDEECTEAIAVEATAGGAVVPLRTRVAAAAQTPLIFESHHARVPPPGCVAPLEWAAKKEWADVRFLPPKHRPFGARALPSANLRDGVCPLVVTTAFRAAYEHRCGGAWRTVIPLALAPRVTRIVTTKKSKLADLKHYALMKQLGGRCIAVGDPTSTYAARLIAAARHYGIRTHPVEERPKRPDRQTLYLVTKDFRAMAMALERNEIDGFATVEPFPTLAEDSLKAHYGKNYYAEAILGPHCTSTSTGFCCVVMAPRVLIEAPQYADTRGALVRTLFKSLWRVLEDARLEVVGHENTKRGEIVPAQAAEKRAAAAMLRHFLDDLDLVEKTPSELIDTLVERFVPEVTPESLNADYETISGFLSAGKLRTLKKAGDPVALYDTAEVRSLCRAALEEEFGDTPLDVVRDAKRAYSAP